MNYADIEQAFNNRRNGTDFKVFHRTWSRILKDGDAYNIIIASDPHNWVPFLRVCPDDTVTVLCDIRRLGALQYPQNVFAKLLSRPTYVAAQGKYIKTPLVAGVKIDLKTNQVVEAPAITALRSNRSRTQPVRDYCVLVRRMMHVLQKMGEDQYDPKERNPRRWTEEWYVAIDKLISYEMIEENLAAFAEAALKEGTMRHTYGWMESSESRRKKAIDTGLRRLYERLKKENGYLDEVVVRPAITN